MVTSGTIISGINADFLSLLSQMDPTLERYPYGCYDPASDIEQNIIKGKITIDYQGSSPFPIISCLPSGWNRKLIINNTSSLITEMAPLVLFLRYLVTSDNWLIIEEPEAHLHPKLQVELIRQLAKLVAFSQDTYQIHIMITTHSEWILEAVSNIVTRSYLPNDKSHNPVFNTEEVGIWRFDVAGKGEGTTVSEVEFDADKGDYNSGYDEVINDLHND